MNKLTSIMSIIFILLLLFTGEIYSSEFDGDYTWMLLPTSSRGAALGQSVIAVIDNEITPFSNPGGVVFLNDIEFSYSYCLPYKFDDIEEKYQTFSINKNITNKTKTGFTFQYYNYNGSSKDYSVGILYSKKIENIGIGIKPQINYFLRPTLKYINNPLFSFDLGFSYIKSIDDYGSTISLGASLLNISYDIKYRRVFYTRTSGLPYVFRIGYCMTLKSQVDGKGNSVFSLVHTLEYMDVLNTKDNRYNRFRYDIGSGFEFILNEMLFLRLGYRTKGYISSSRNGFTYGAGLKINLNYFFKDMPISFVYNYTQYHWSPEPNVLDIKNFKIHSFNLQYNL
ncbi:MAG: hypothetical protein ACTSQG_09965 [Promethearchaeota archaeon]